MAKILAFDKMITGPYHTSKQALRSLAVRVSFFKRDVRDCRVF